MLRERIEAAFEQRAIAPIGHAIIDADGAISVLSAVVARPVDIRTGLSNVLNASERRTLWGELMSEEQAGQRTLVTLLLDRTGAAEAIRDQTIEAFNAYLATLKVGAGDHVEFRMIQYYRDSCHPMHVCKPGANVPTLKARTYLPPEGCRP